MSSLPADADVQFWIDHQSYEPDEIATRFHHRLVSIHPFPNGNMTWHHYSPL